MKKTLALITARGGSKEIPGKNIKLLNGKPLIAYTVEHALMSGCFEEVMVTTDSDEIASVAESYGATAPFRRPAALSTDKSKSIDAILHAMQFCEELGRRFDYLFLLQPTSPLRTGDDMRKTMEIIQKGFNGVISVTEAAYPPYSYFQLDKGNILPLDKIQKAVDISRQELPTYYKINGAIYCVDWEMLKAEKTLYL